MYTAVKKFSALKYLLRAVDITNTLNDCDSKERCKYLDCTYVVYRHIYTHTQ